MLEAKHLEFKCLIATAHIPTAFYRLQLTRPYTIWYSTELFQDILMV